MEENPSKIITLKQPNQSQTNGENINCKIFNRIFRNNRGEVLQHLRFCRRGNRENNNNSNTAAIDNNNRVKIVVDTENRGNHHVNKNKVNESYY